MNKYGLATKEQSSILALLKKYHEIEEVILFGSRAMNKHTAVSDIDLAIKGNYINKIIGSLKSNFEESSLIYEVDVIDYQSISSDKLIEHIRRYGKVFYRKGWIETTLGELVSLAQGVAINAKTKHVLCKKKEGMPLLKINNLLNNTEDQYANPTLVTSKAIIKKDDVIFTRTGQVGWVFTGKRGILHNNSFKVMPSDKLNSKFIFWFLKQKTIYSYVQKVASGSAQPDLNHDAFKIIQINLPPLTEQKAIAAVLSSFDEKIELLREQNQTLETLAQTIFKEWFVNFNFPNSTGEMVDSELGEIPKGWKTGELGDIIKNIRNGISISDIQASTPYIALQDMPRKQIALDKWGLSNNLASNKFIFRDGNILFGKLRPYFHKVGVAFTSGVCSTDILVLEEKEKFLFCFSLMIVSNDDFIKYVTLASEGTRMPRTNWSYMKNYKIIIPDQTLLSFFNDTISIFILKIKNNTSQIQILTKTRDTLLPKLMSGELRVDPYRNEAA